MTRRVPPLAILMISAVTLLFSSRAHAQTATTAGAVTTPYPTSQGISIEWAISGDSNNNGVVTVRYRPTGSSSWKTGMSLFRIPAGSNGTGDFGSGGGMWSNKHSGSLFDLDPGTSYEIELTLTDPDGGSMTKTTTVATRAIPVAAANAPVKAVTPSNLSSMLSSAAAGDVLLLGAGTYPAFTVSKSGSAGQPIVIRGASVDDVIVNGRITATDRQYVYLENLTVMGEVRLNGSSSSVVRGCKIRSSSNGITFQMGNDIPRNNTILDNDVLGAAVWQNDQLSSTGFNGGEGIQFTGSGHVVCFNHVKDFRDDISMMEYDEAYEQTSNDICNNDIDEATDDAIEADSAMGNIRVFRNRIRNCFSGISGQPDLGGPSYYVRNTMFNVALSPFKMNNETVGDVALHNTVLHCGDAFGCYAGATWSRAFYRNNVFIGGMGGGTYGGVSNGSGRIFDLADADTSCSFDYDGVASIGTGKFEGKIGDARFTSLATLQSNTTEVHAVSVDLSIFATQPTFPTNPFPPKDPVDFRLAAGSAAIDKGVTIPGLNEDFAGAAPDLGAFELGAAVPTYGPRTGGTGTTTGTGGSTGSSGTGGSSGAAGTSGGRGGSVGPSGSAGRGGSVGSSGAAGAVAAPGAAGSSAAAGAQGGPGGDPVTGAASGGCGCTEAGGGGGPAALLLLCAALARARRRPTARAAAAR